jgi:hypothetical protein
MQVSPKTAVGKAQREFHEKRSAVTSKGWETRREKYGDTGRRQSDG